MSSAFASSIALAEGRRRGGNAGPLISIWFVVASFGSCGSLASAWLELLVWGGRGWADLMGLGLSTALQCWTLQPRVRPYLELHYRVVLSLSVVLLGVRVKRASRETIGSSAPTTANSSNPSIEKRRKERPSEPEARKAEGDGDPGGQTSS